jgi:hypothetical protein
MNKNNSNSNSKKYRIIPIINNKLILESYVLDMINVYGDIDPDKYNGDIILDI